MIINNQMLEFIILVQKITDIFALLALIIIFSRGNNLIFILAIIANEAIMIIPNLYREASADEVGIIWIRILLMPFFMVWRWNILGVLLSIILNEAIVTIPFLLKDKINQPVYYGSDGGNEQLLVMIFAMITTGIATFIYCLFILIIKFIWLSILLPKCKSIFRKIRGFFD